MHGINSRWDPTERNNRECLLSLYLLLLMFLWNKLCGIFFNTEKKRIECCSEN